MGGFPNQYLELPKPHPAQAEIEVGNYAVMIARALRVPMPLPGDVLAIHRTGELLRRWWRNNFTLRNK